MKMENEAPRSREGDKAIEDLDTRAIVDILERENLLEFRELVETQQLNGKKITNVTEGNIKLWQPEINAAKLLHLIENLKINPQQYIETKSTDRKKSITFNGKESNLQILIKSFNLSFETSQTVVEKVPQNQDFEVKMVNAETVEKIPYTEPRESLLYRNSMKRISKMKEKINSSYVPMDMATPKQSKSNFKLNDYTNFELPKLNMFPTGNRKQEKKFNDRGYYALNGVSVVNETDHCYDLVGDNDGTTISDDHLRTNSEKAATEDHLYEDLNYCPVDKTNISNLEPSATVKNLIRLSNARRCILWINKIFSTFKFPINYKSRNSSGKIDVNVTIINLKDTIICKEDREGDKKEFKTDTIREREEKKPRDNKDTDEASRNTAHQSKLYLNRQDYFYEGHEKSSVLYDSIEAGLNNTQTEAAGRFRVTKVADEEYLVPIQASKEYADVLFKEKSPVSVVLRMFGFGKECDQSRAAPGDQSKPTHSNTESVEPPERPMDTLHKRNVSMLANFRPEVKKRADGRALSNPETVTKMADRPLPVPVESEFYYMEVDRLEASKLLEGHADGTFILRPSSQPFHMYTISLMFRGQVHNVGVRRRPDGKLALGYPKRSEQSFQTIKDLIEHYYKEKLLLIVDGQKIGSTHLMKIDG